MNALVDERLVRKEILRILKVFYPDGVAANGIATSLIDAGYTISVPEVLQQLAYLSDKGYVSVRELKSEHLGKRDVARLLPKGIDLLDENIEKDPGIL